MKKDIVLACVLLTAFAMPTATFAQQPNGDNHDHHDVRPPPPPHHHHHHHHHAAPPVQHESNH
ncbi:hypothetical protein PQQ96_06090 [Paraburkholderia sediminicola]|uniref:hypothetical protein n=1 Tax=Paraburkholderia sediminicola TaxID=458836 RepID=UPI0038BDFEC5